MQTAHLAFDNAFTGKRLRVLDGLRAMAILIVLWHNCTAGLYHGNSLIKIINLVSNAGWIGVQLFFVLSGFLITGILLDSEKSPRQIRNFYARRVLRIFPPYYMLLIVMCFVVPMLRMQTFPLIDHFGQNIWYWLFLNNWSSPLVDDTPMLGHLWSLAVEEQFYLVWPACVLFLPRKTLFFLCVGAIVTAIITRLGLTLYDLKFAEAAAYKFTIARWDALATGAALAILIRQFQYQEMLHKWWRLVAYIAAAYIVLFMLIDRNFAPVGPGLILLNQTISAFLFAALIFWAAEKQESTSRSRRFLLHPAMQSIGKYSYAMYLFHMPIILLSGGFWTKHTVGLSTHHPAFSITLYALFVFAVSYLLAMVSWICIEQPCLKLKRFFNMSYLASGSTPLSAQARPAG